MADRTALLIRCSREEADLVRKAARAERRTISGFVLNAIMTRIQARTRLATPAPPPLADKQVQDS